jgi:hypothetical protein
MPKDSIIKEPTPSLQRAFEPSRWRGQIQQGFLASRGPYSSIERISRKRKTFESRQLRLPVRDFRQQPRVRSAVYQVPFSATMTFVDMAAETICGASSM